VLWVWAAVVRFLAVVLVMAIAALAVSCGAIARDLGQWSDVDPAVKAWFGRLMQPDTVGQMGRGVSCCGESDAYYADESHVRCAAGVCKSYAVITDDRDDGPLIRIHEDIGTEYEIPANKIVGNEQRLGNPTGHTIIFLGTRFWLPNNKQGPRPVLCYVMNGGV